MGEWSTSVKDWADCELLTPIEVGQKFDQLQ